MLLLYIFTMSLEKKSYGQVIILINERKKCVFSKVGGLDLSRRDLDRDLDLDVQKISVSTVEKISTVFKS